MKEASKFLECHDRRIHPIQGDGNCLFRALSYLLFGHEDNHQQVRHTLVDYTVKNQEAFSEYCTGHSIEDHAAWMKHETKWGTDLEIRAAASYLQLPIYTCTQKSKSLHYYWECFQPLNTLTQSKRGVDIHLLPKTIRHLELCHRNRCHYDVIEMSDGGRPTRLPPLVTTTVHIDLTTA